MVRVADVGPVVQRVFSARLWFTTLLVPGLAWVAQATPLTCSSEDVLQAVKVIARHRIEQISSDYERSPFERPDPLVTGSIRAGSATWKLNYIREQAAVAEAGVPRCAAVLTVKGPGDARARFNVDYTARTGKGEMLVTVATDDMRPQ